MVVILNGATLYHIIFNKSVGEYLLINVSNFNKIAKVNVSDCISLRNNKLNLI